MLPLLRCAVWALAWACALAPLPGAAQGRARIVTLTPSLTEAVCALGQCERLVATGVTSQEEPQRVTRD